VIAAGTRLGPYEILAPIGTGGMGEVYRARDARLAAPLGRIDSFALSKDGRFLYATENKIEADIWEATLK
jgi:serine/threonine protein kinase